MRNARRAVGTALLVGGLVAAMVTVAFGAGDSVTTTATFSPSHPKASKKGVQLNWVITITGANGARPANLATSDLLLPPGITADGAGLATCSMAKLQSNDVKSCPASSIVGHATGDINVQPIQDPTMSTSGPIYATKAKAGKPPELAIFYTVDQIPSAHAIAQIKFVKSGKRWKVQYILPDLPTAPGLPNATPVDSHVMFDVKGPKGYVLRATKPCARNTKLPSRTTFHDGSSTKSVAKAC